jgi:hypothetical protein
VKNAINKLFSAEKGQPLLFIVMIYLVGAITNALADVLKGWLTPWQITLGGTIIIILFMLFVNPFSKLINKIVNSGTFSTTTLQKKSYKGLIVFASKGDNPSAANAIREHINNLKKCWIITGDTNEIEGSKKNALSLTEIFKEELKKKNDPNFFQIVEMPGEFAYDPAKVYEKIESIFADLPEGITEKDVISDYTGGTKSMTAGMILSCALPSRDLQVLKPKVFKSDGTADRNKGEESIGIDIHFKIKKTRK